MSVPLRLADCGGLTVTTVAIAAAVGPHDAWSCESAEEQNSCAEDEKHSFHGCFLLGVKNWTRDPCTSSPARNNAVKSVDCPEFVTRVAL